MFSHGHYTEFSSLTASKKNKIDNEHFGISLGQCGSIMVTIPIYSAWKVSLFAKHNVDSDVTVE